MAMEELRKLALLGLGYLSLQTNPFVKNPLSDAAWSEYVDCISDCIDYWLQAVGVEQFINGMISDPGPYRAEYEKLLEAREYGSLCEHRNFNLFRLFKTVWIYAEERIALEREV